MESSRSSSGELSAMAANSHIEKLVRWRSVQYREENGKDVVAVAA
jgi:hypothetical protein